jgi:hypothetical protein
MPAKNKFKLSKHTLKFLQHCNDPKLLRYLIGKSPDPVIKAICNASLNALKGEIKFSKLQKKLLRRHRNFIDSVILSSSIPISQKRQAIIKTQSGRGFLAAIPIILSAALPLLGSAIQAIRNKND